MQLQIVCLRYERAVWPNEEKCIVNEAIEHVDIAIELRLSQLRSNCSINA